MIKHRFNVPRHAINSTRRELNSARFKESLALREALGYLQNDRHSTTESPPALLLKALKLDHRCAAVATLETLGTVEGEITQSLVNRLDLDEYRFTLAVNDYGKIQGIDFELTSLATRQAVRRALAPDFDDAVDIAQALVYQPPQAIELPESRDKPEMIAPHIIQKAREMEREQAAERERRNVKPLTVVFD